MGVITIRVKRASKFAGLPGHIGGLGATLPDHIGLLFSQYGAKCTKYCRVFFLRN